MAPVLGYWNLRGLCEPIRYLLHHAEVDFEDRRYDFKTEPPYDYGKWGQDKTELGLDFPNLPYLLDGDLKLTQSLAILRHLGRQHGLAGDDEAERSVLDMVEQQAKDLQVGLILLAYNTTPSEFQGKRDRYLSEITAKLRPFEDFLKNKSYVLVDKLSYVDFLLYEVLDYHLLLSPACLDSFQNLRDYVDRIKGLPNVRRYIESDKFKRWPIFAPFASFGGSGQPPN